MMRDPWIAASLWMAWVFTIYVSCRLGQIAADHARVWWENHREPIVGWLKAKREWLREMYHGWRNRKALKQHREVYGYSDPGRPRVASSSSAGAVGIVGQRSLYRRAFVQSQRAAEGSRSADGSGSRVECRAQSAGARQGGVVSASVVNGHTRLTYTPKGVA